jgi:hypothetical protein
LFGEWWSVGDGNRPGLFVYYVLVFQYCTLGCTDRLYEWLHSSGPLLLAFFLAVFAGYQFDWAYFNSAYFDWAFFNSALFELGSF